jgi:ribosomal protein L11 methyltransferase
MNWTRVTIRAAAESYELVTAVLLENGIESHELFEDGAKVRVVFYTANGADSRIEPVAEALEAARAFPSSGTKTDFEVSIEEIPDFNWQKAFLESYHSFELGKKFLVAPTWEKVERKSRRKIMRIDPGQAFGTGLHATTALAIRSLEKNVKKNSRVLDAGTGSGILAIAAALLGASVVATDNDPTAIVVARENFKTNCVSEKIELVECDLASADSDAYNVVVANILLEPIMRFLPVARKMLIPGGVMIGTGILIAQRKELEAALQTEGFANVVIETMGEWILFEASPA